MASLNDMTVIVELTDKAQAQLDFMLAEIRGLRAVVDGCNDARSKLTMAEERLTAQTAMLHSTARQLEDTQLELDLARGAYDVMHEAWDKVPFPAIIRLENNAPADPALEDSWQQVADWIGTPFVEEWLGKHE